MSDNSYKPNRPPRLPTRQPRAGEEVWRLKHPDGRVQSCRLRANPKSVAGWDLQILEGDEILVSLQGANERYARFVAEKTRRDLLRMGWNEKGRQ